MAKAAETFVNTAPIAGAASYIGRRYSLLESVSLTTSSTTTPEVDLREYAGGIILVPNGSSLTALTFWAGDKLGGAYEALHDAAAAAVTRIVAADQAVPIPDECFGCGFMRITGNVAGTVTITLKA